MNGPDRRCLPRQFNRVYWLMSTKHSAMGYLLMSHYALHNYLHYWWIFKTRLYTKGTQGTQRGLLTEPVWTYFPRVYWWRLRRSDTWRTRWSLLAAAGLMWVGLHTHTHTNTDVTTAITLTHIYIHQRHARAYVFVCMERWPAATRRGTGCRWGPGRSCCTSRLPGRCNTRPWTPGLRRRRWRALKSQTPAPRTTGGYTSLPNSCGQEEDSEGKTNSREGGKSITWVRAKQIKGGGKEDPGSRRRSKGNWQGNHWPKGKFRKKRGNWVLVSSTAECLTLPHSYPVGDIQGLWINVWIICHMTHTDRLEMTGQHRKRVNLCKLCLPEDCQHTDVLNTSTTAN